MKVEQPTFDEKILKLLKENRGVYTSGVEIGKNLDLSRTAVWKHMGNLRKAGYEIDAIPNLGYRLLSSPDLMTSAEIESGLKTKYIGKKIHAFSLTDSTNTKAFELALHGAPEGTVIVAEGQRKGKGRLGRKWESPKGVNVYASIVLRPKIAPSSASQITLLAAVATARAIEKATKILPDIKWPNDLLIRNRKVAGILMELDSEADMVNFIVLGIGIDINMDINSLPPDVAKVATSIKNETGRTIERVPLVQELFRQLEKWYEIFKADGFGPIITEWERLSIMAGKYIRVSFLKETKEGVALGLDTDGALLLRLPTGRIERVVAGDVTMVR
ncbi:MAG: biotin--[acetyl-CoA-carboxylase] ligase [Deltaproteobacteria bacterium]|nr:biotin--[acetyl-CoA-carboxylase] ligase [Deltaproteobacteria bacterium]